MNSEADKKKAVIYTLSDPRDGIVRYVGRTCNVYQRFYGHFSNGDGTRKKQAWIFELRHLNLTPIMTVIEEVEPPYNAKRRELYWIRAYLEQGIPLLNGLRCIRSSERKDWKI